jgi:RNase_H superfamily
MPKKQTNKPGPRILLLDIETAPIIAYTWGLWDQTVALNQIKQDWHVLSWAAKWLDDGPNKVMYQDQRNEKDITNDKKILQGIWKLLDEADIVIGQNSKAFDIKKLNARFIMHGMQPPSSYRQIDTLSMAKKHFAFTSNKLEYMTDKLCVKYKKLQHGKFPGFSMWKACLAGNKDAWKEMEKYNKYDVLSLEELYNKLAAWDSTVNFAAYQDDLAHTCSCGHKEFRNKGYAYTSSGKFHRYQCFKCGKESRGKENLLTKEKRQAMRR